MNSHFVVEKYSVSSDIDVKENWINQRHYPKTRQKAYRKIVTKGAAWKTVTENSPAETQATTNESQAYDDDDDDEEKTVKISF